MSLDFTSDKSKSIGRNKFTGLNSNKSVNSIDQQLGAPVPKSIIRPIKMKHISSKQPTPKRLKPSMINFSASNAPSLKQLADMKKPVGSAAKSNNKAPVPSWL